MHQGSAQAGYGHDDWNNDSLECRRSAESLRLADCLIYYFRLRRRSLQKKIANMALSRSSISVKETSIDWSTEAERCVRKFLRYFKQGFADPKYFDWERGYKLEAHRQFHEALNRDDFADLLKSKKYLEIAAFATRIESKTNLLFSFEKMAFRDAVREVAGATAFAHGLFDLIHGDGEESTKFEKWCETVESLPRRQTRVLTHPIVTVFPFIADPKRHIFLKPNVTRRAADAYGYDFHYESRPSWKVYSSLLGFARQLKRDLRSLKPKDMIDFQSFIWVQGSEEYS